MGNIKNYRKIIISIAGVLFIILILAPTNELSGDEDLKLKRFFFFNYETQIGPIPKGKGPIDIFIPISQSDSHQKIITYEINSRVIGNERIEQKYGNRFWHSHLKKSDGKVITIVVKYKVMRKIFQQKLLKESTETALSQSDRNKYISFLKPNKRVPVSASYLDEMRKNIPKTGPSLYARSRAIYDFVIDNMEYKKVGEGWGHGDTYWACSKRYGNCTDFHALFISLARSEGIPSRFEIGFPIPENKASGQISGYHCWVELYIPKVGWFPIDASEAWKNPKKRDFYFGTGPVDRILFTLGRDLELGTGHNCRPLNFFIFPHIEVDGKSYTKFKTKFSFVEIS